MCRLALITVFAFTVFGFSADEAFALGHVSLGKHNEKDIKDHCNAANGISFDSEGVYGCFGPGGDVTCSKKTKTCYGTCEKCGELVKPHYPFGTCKTCSAESIDPILRAP